MEDMGVVGVRPEKAEERVRWKKLIIAATSKGNRPKEKRKNKLSGLVATETGRL